MINKGLADLCHAAARLPRWKINRSGSVDSENYRYGFQGQEGDNEVKGKGSSYNYKYRMHDPRIGRFFAVDPLFRKYSFYSPYHFSSNQPIHTFELEGLESRYDISHNDPALFMLNLSNEERLQYYKGQALGFATGGIIALDVYFTKGRATKFLLKQLGVQLAVNTAVSGIHFIVEDDYEFNAEQIVSDTFTGFDLADAGIDFALSKSNIGKIKEIVTVIAPTLFDLTYEDGIQVVGVNKDTDKILTDLIGNILMSGIETAAVDRIDLPTIKLSAAREAEILGGYINDLLFNSLDEEFNRVNEVEKFYNPHEEVSKSFENSNENTNSRNRLDTRSLETSNEGL